MCTDEIYTWASCHKVEIRHKVCLAHITTTHTQLSQPTCPTQHTTHRTSEDRYCTCRWTGRRCKQGTWALKGDGNHSWSFEEDRKAKKKWPGKQEEEEREEREREEWEDEDEDEVSPKTQTRKKIKIKREEGEGEGEGETSHDNDSFRKSGSFENPPPVEELDADLEEYEREQYERRHGKLMGRDVKIKAEPVSDEEMGF